MTAHLPTPQQLRYLLALAEHRHFGRAASACAVTQSTLSAGILALERQLDAKVLDRALGKRVVFTPVGREIADRARAALAALEAVAEAAASSRAPLTGPLRLGVIPTIGPFLLPRLMPALRAAFPKLRLFLREDMTQRLITDLKAGALDITLIALPYDVAGLEWAHVSHDELLAAFPAGHPLAATPTVSSGALDAETLILLEDGHCLRDHALSACGLGPQKSTHEEGFAATSLATLVQMVGSGLGISLLPAMAVEAGLAHAAQVAVRPLTPDLASREIVVAWRAGSTRAAEGRLLAEVFAGARAGRLAA
jgi:LysR family hydrogen peroxide-inducible transcriptional activator